MTPYACGRGRVVRSVSRPWERIIRAPTGQPCSDTPPAPLNARNTPQEADARLPAAQGRYVSGDSARYAFRVRPVQRRPWVALEPSFFSSTLAPTRGEEGQKYSLTLAPGGTPRRPRVGTR